MNRRTLLSIAASAAFLSGCGGGASDPLAPMRDSAAPGAPDAPAAPSAAGVAPSITAPPANATVTAGTPVTFGVVATGTAPLAYQWLRDGAAIPGATGPTLTLASPTLADNGARFSVLVTNAAGSVTSDAALLGVARGLGISLLAGGIGGKGFLDAVGSAARFDTPLGTAVDAAGNVYIADNHTIRKITPEGAVSTLAGKAGDFGGVDGPGIIARFFDPVGLCCDAAGNVYVAERGGQTVRKITPAGDVSTVAGLFDNPGSADGLGSAARFQRPSAVTIDAVGNLYVADTLNNRIRKITPAGAVTTLAGSGAAGVANGNGTAATFTRPEGLVFDAAAGVLYVADTANCLIRAVTPAGDVTTLAGSGSAGGTDAIGTAADFKQPVGLAVAGGVLYVADRGNNSIRAIDAARAVTTFAGRSPTAGMADGTGSAARFAQPHGLAADAAGNLYVGDSLNAIVRRISPARAVSTLAGAAYQQGSADGTGTAARFYAPYAVALDAAGTAYVADTGNHVIRKITPDGTVTTVAGDAGSSGSADGIGAAARFDSPAGIAVDAAGTLYVADSANHLIRRISPAGAVTTLCGGLGTADGAGVAGRFNNPSQLALTASGDLVVADTYNHAIRKVTPAGVVSTIAGSPGAPGFFNGVGTAARFDQPYAVAIDAAGAIFVTDSVNQVIRRIAPNGTVTTFAGTAGAQGSADGTGAAARFRYPFGIAIDAAGTLYVADTINHTLRKIDPAANVTTLFGQPGQMGVHTGSAPGAFSRPVAVASDSAGKLLLVADSNENAVIAIAL